LHELPLAFLWLKIRAVDRQRQTDVSTAAFLMQGGSVSPRDSGESIVPSIVVSFRQRFEIRPLEIYSSCRDHAAELCGPRKDGRLLSSVLKDFDLANAAWRADGNAAIATPHHRHR
jgi:hypothetical protein